jgi:hypothetical protein
MKMEMTFARDCKAVWQKMSSWDDSANPIGNIIIKRKALGAFGIPYWEIRMV